VTQTQDAPAFTVVMPCFRARETIVMALNSVLAQTAPDFELFIVDDGSPDDTAAVAMSAAAGDRRVRLIRQDNAGPAAARNRGMEAGTGGLLAFIDSDDRWAVDLLARHRDHFAAQPELGVSFARIRFYDAAMSQPGRCSAHLARLDLCQALGENPVCTTSNVATRRTVFDQVGGFDTALTHAEDQEWVVRVLATTDWEVAGLDRVLVDYRTSPSGLSADLGRMAAGWRTMIERARGYAPEAVAAAETPASALFERYLARRALRTGQPSTRALAHMCAAIRHSPRALIACDFRRTLLTAAGAVGAALLPAAVIRSALSR
jgi:glycosyltransferase involved in cell wall biosynthesis